MRVAIVTETFLPSVNGVVRMLLEYLAYLESHGHEAIIFAPGDGERTCHGYEVVRVSGVPFPLYPELILAPYSTRLGRTLRSWRPDVVHLASPFVLGMHGLQVARSLGVPVAAHYQTDVARYAEHFGLRALSGMAWHRLLSLHNACDVTFAPTPSVARELTQRGMERVRVSGRGVDSVLFHPDRRDPQWRARLDAGDEQPVFLYVGRLSVEKNLGLLASVARAMPDYPLLIVGEGPAGGLLATQVSGCRAHFTGVLRGDDLARAYASADIFLFPSATETFGQVAREAMASGLPVIAMRSGGVQDLIADGQTGLLCQVGDDESFIDAARRLADDALLRRRMGAAARAAAEHETWEGVFERLMGWYAGLASASIDGAALARA